MSDFDIIVIGSGVAGLTAGKHAAQNGLATAGIEAALHGGLIINVNELDGISGAPVSGYRTATRLKMENMKLGVAGLAETVTGLAVDGDRIVVETSEDKHHARAVVVASGAQLKRLGIPGEEEFSGRGVSQCADCDGPIYKDKDVVVIGGGDSALQSALTLAKQCRKVFLMHRGEQFRAQTHLIDSVGAKPNIEPVWNTVAERVAGSKAVATVAVKNVLTGEAREIPCSGFFAFVGLRPNSDFLPPEIRRDASGFILTDAARQTAMANVFAAGVVRAGCGGLLSDAIADAQAAIDGARLAIK